MTPRALIRPASLDDAAEIAELVTDLGYATSALAMRERLSFIAADPDKATFVADAGGTVQGVAGVSVDRSYERDGCYSRLLVLVVASASRGGGIGRLLVEAVEDWARARGAQELYVNSGLHRGDAHAFYERAGFTRNGFRFVKPLA
jgi:GNAT superfamily N-acetyltransferase